MISFVARLPSVIFTEWQPNRPPIPSQVPVILEPTGPIPERSRPILILSGKIQTQRQEIERIKSVDIPPLKAEENRYLQEIEDIERDVARWEREAKRIKDKLRKALASHSSITADINAVKTAIEDVKKLMSSITGSGSQSLEDDLRHLESQRIDLERDLKYSRQKIEQLSHELWGVNQLKQSHQKRIDTALGEVNRVRRAMETLLCPAVDTLLDLERQLRVQGGVPVGEPITDCTP